MKKVLVLLTVLCISVVVFSGLAFAAGMAGTLELGAFGSSTSMKVEGVDDTIDTTSIQVNSGYFLNDNLQVGGAVSSSISTFAGSESSSNTLYGFAKYHFTVQNTMLPYAGLQVGVVSNESTSTSTDGFGNETTETTEDTVAAYGAMGGIKFFLSESVSLNVELNFLRFDLDDGAGGTIGVDVTTLWFGTSYYFGKSEQSVQQ